MEYFFIIILLGVVGGLSNSISAGIRKPRWRRDEKTDETVLDLGTIGNVIIGGAAAGLYRGFEMGNLEEPQVYATAFITGWAGARIINDILEHKVLNVATNTLSVELGEQMDVIAILEEEIDSLEKQLKKQQEEEE